MEMDFVGISIAVEIAAEHDGARVGTGDWRQLRLQRRACGFATAAIGLGQREAVSPRDELQLADVMRTDPLAHNQRDRRRKDQSSGDGECSHRPPGTGCLSGIGPV